MIYDAHIHCKGKESGGFIVGLEGEPRFPNTLNNEQALALHNVSNKTISFYYVTKEECEKTNPILWKYLKYHPRREKYKKEEVIGSISRNKPAIVMIDTLNEPDWSAYDYWKIARAFPDIAFIFSHAGGYLINDFLKICHFQNNVWIDFALTHTTLGKLGKKDGLTYVNQGIYYALHSSFNNRILLASDYPFFCQEDVFEYYHEYVPLLNNNYERLISSINGEEYGN